MKLKATSLLKLDLPKKIGAAISESLLIKGLICCLVGLLIAGILCYHFVGSETILKYASENSPWTLIVNPDAYADFKNNEDAAKIVCFGDSSYFFPYHYQPTTDHVNTYFHTLLGKELRARTGSQDFVVSQRAFAGATTFDYYCMLYEAADYSPDLIIVPVNWRSFGYSWIESATGFHPKLTAFVPLRDEIVTPYENPLKSRGISLAKQMEYKFRFFLLYPIGMKSWALDNARTLFVALNKKITPPAFAEQENVQLETPSEPSGEKQKMVVPKAIHMYQDLRGIFPMDIEPSNLTFRSLSAFAHVASERGQKVVIFIWPLDQELLSEIETLDRPVFEQSMQRIKDATDRENVYLVDLSGKLEHKYFFDILGHCKVQGRMKIAEMLTPEILDILDENSGAGS